MLAQVVDMSIVLGDRRQRQLHPEIGISETPYA